MLFGTDARSGRMNLTFPKGIYCSERNKSICKSHIER